MTFHIKGKSIGSLFNDGVVLNNKYILCCLPVFIALLGHFVVLPGHFIALPGHSVQCLWIYGEC